MDIAVAAAGVECAVESFAVDVAIVCDQFGGAAEAIGAHVAVAGMCTSTLVEAGIWSSIFTERLPKLKCMDGNLTSISTRSPVC